MRVRAAPRKSYELLTPAARKGFVSIATHAATTLNTDPFYVVELAKTSERTTHDNQTDLHPRRDSLRNAGCRGHVGRRGSAREHRPADDQRDAKGRRDAHGRERHVDGQPDGGPVPVAAVQLDPRVLRPH